MSGIFHQLREALTPQLTQSKFKTNGLLTPDEFIIAGDYLVGICPSWQWVSNTDHDHFTVRDYLPLNKQFLISKNVSAKPFYDNIHEELVDDDLLINNPSSVTVEVDDLNAVNLDVDLSDSFDVMITYDKYYQTPRVWLIGYDKNGSPMTPATMMTYISSDHALKTATIEQHPHLQVTCVSIHPCQHASVMKLLFSNDIKVEKYMVAFLKFISTVIPTIEYDYLE
eukprot:NODE_53_length_26956_cov_0.387348.p13 type:complete len:225 gc:universal NODE_53_length_26956_cov_0.387348:20341-21015(+)